MKTWGQRAGGGQCGRHWRAVFRYRRHLWSVGGARWRVHGVGVGWRVLHLCVVMRGQMVAAVAAAAVAAAAVPADL